MASFAPQAGWVKRSTRPTRRPAYFAEAKADSRDETSADQYDIFAGNENDDEQSDSQYESDYSDEEAELPQRRVIRSVGNARRRARKKSTILDDFIDHDMTSDDEPDDAYGDMTPSITRPTRHGSSASRFRGIARKVSTVRVTKHSNRKTARDYQDSSENESDINDKEPTPSRHVPRATSSASITPQKNSLIQRQISKQRKTPNPEPRVRPASPAWIPLSQNPERYEPTQTYTERDKLQRARLAGSSVPQPWTSSSSYYSLPDLMHDDSEDGTDSDFDDGDDEEWVQPHGALNHLPPFYSIMDPRNPNSPKNFKSCMAHLPPDDETVEQTRRREKKKEKSLGLDEDDDDESDESEYVDDEEMED